MEIKKKMDCRQCSKENSVELYKGVMLSTKRDVLLELGICNDCNAIEGRWYRLVHIQSGYTLGILIHVCQDGKCFSCFQILKMYSFHPMIVLNGTRGLLLLPYSRYKDY